MDSKRLCQLLKVDHKLIHFPFLLAAFSLALTLKLFYLLEGCVPIFCTLILANANGRTGNVSAVKSSGELLSDQTFFLSRNPYLNRLPFLLLLDTFSVK